jgi:hypothetical protein
MALRARTIRDQVEYGATFDLDSGHAIGGILMGEGNDLDIYSHLALLEPTHHYVTLHTHPASRPPSLQDGAVLSAHLLICSLMIVGANGTWYALSRQPGVPQVSEREAREMIGAAFMIVRAGALAAQQAHGWTDEQTLDVLLHSLWSRIAPRLGLRYDRLGSSNRPEKR